MQEMQRLEYNGETVMSDWLVGESFPEEVIGELSLERRVGSGGAGVGHKENCPGREHSIWWELRHFPSTSHSDFQERWVGSLRTIE